MLISYVQDKVPVKYETRKWEWQANIEEGDKNCQDIKFMQPVQPAKKKSCYMCSMPRPAVSQSSYKKKKSLHVDQCQSTVCFDKNYQVNMWPVKPAKQSIHMQSVEPASCKMCDDKNC